MSFTVDEKNKLATQMHQALLAGQFSTAQLTAVIDKRGLPLEGDFSGALKNKIAGADVVAKNLQIIENDGSDINDISKAQAFRQAALRALACHQIDSGKPLVATDSSTVQRAKRLLDIAKLGQVGDADRTGIRKAINEFTLLKGQVTATDNETQLTKEDCTAIQQAAVRQYMCQKLRDDDVLALAVAKAPDRNAFRGALKASLGENKAGVTAPSIEAAFNDGTGDPDLTAAAFEQYRKAAILKLAKQDIDGLDGTKKDTLLKVATADEAALVADGKPDIGLTGVPEAHITAPCLLDIQKHAAMTLVLRSIGGDTANDKKMVAVAALVKQDPAKDDVSGLKAYLKKKEDGRALCGLGADNDAGVRDAVIDALTLGQLHAIQAKAVAQLANRKIETENNDIPVQALVDASSDDDAKARAGIVALVGGSPKADSTKLSGPDVELVQKNARRRLKVLLSKTFNDKVAEVCKLIAKSAVHAPDLQARAQCALMFKGFKGAGFHSYVPKWSKTPVDSSLGEASDTNTNANNDDVSIVCWKTEQGMFKVTCDAKGHPKRVSFPAEFSQKKSYNKADKDLIKGLVTALKPEKEGDQQSQPPLHFSGTNATPEFLKALQVECNKQDVGLTIPDGLTISGKAEKGKPPLIWDVDQPVKGAGDLKFVKQEPEPSPNQAAKPCK